MAKFRTRVKGAKKAKKWAKGHSSDSNPSVHKFRENAKSRFFQNPPNANTRESKLTVEAVELFNQTSGPSTRGDRMEDDLVSFGGTTTTVRTFDTFASDWSACSNQSFSRLMSKFRADSALHKDMLAVLAAVTEVIKQSGGGETSTEYFGALLTALMSEEYGDDEIAAIVNLLAMGIKSVPIAVLRLKFSEATTTLLKLLDKYSSTDRAPLLRSIISCLSVLLRAQDAPSWSDESTLNVLRAILAFASFSKPKVRKAAQHGIVGIVRHSGVTHAGHAEIASHCTRLVEAVCTSGGVTTTLHVLSLLKDVVHSFPKKQLKACCEAILKIMTLNNVLINSCSMQALNGLFASATSDNLPPQLAAKLINALYDYQPPPTDSQPISAWITLMQQAHVHLAKSDARLCALNLPRLYRTLAEFFLTERLDTSTVVTLALQHVTSECLSESTPPTQMGEIVEVHHSLLSYQYFKSMNLVLHLMTALFKSVGAAFQPQLIPIVKTLAEFRETNQTLFPKEIDNAIGAAVRSLGPEAIIQALPLVINNSVHDFKRSWLLPILKDNIRGSTLKCFIDHFLPLTTLCKNEADKYKVSNDQIKALSYDLLQSQIWALLPSFANQPTDIAATFPSIAKALGGVLGARGDLRLVVLATLRLLVSFSIDGDRVDDAATLARFAKNFLPILFNIYATRVSRSDEEGVRLAALETIKVYLKLAQPELCHDLFTRALAKAAADGSDKFAKESSLDLLRALAPHQNEANVRSLYNLIELNIGQGKSQKKYYKLLEALMTSTSENCRNFLKENIDDITKLILGSYEETGPSSKGARLKCIAQLLDESPDDKLPESILPEVVLSLKEVNSKTRATGYKILAALLERDVDFVVPHLLAGLMNDGLAPCCILALASSVYHCKDKLSSEMESNIVQNVSALALSSNREIVSAAMSFFRVFVTSQGRDKVAAHAPRLVKVFSAMNEDCKKRNRNRTRDILARLIRWYGADVILPMIPAEDEILLLRARNLAKIHGRKQRKRASERASQATGQTAVTTFSVANRHKTIEEILAESDDDLEAEEDDEKTENRKKGASKTWITESGEDIVDFTDRRVAARNITGTKPEELARDEQRGSGKSAKSAFKKAPDGRLIIMDDDSGDDDDDRPAKRRKKSVLPGVEIPDEDDFEDSSDDGDWMTTADSKRPRSESSAGTRAAPSKYRAGGRGIHRPLSTASGGKRAKKGAPSSIYGQTGEEYRSAKGRGDVKRKGKPDPFAYLPLRRDALNKRKRMKAMGNLKNVLNAAKKGVALGTKKKMLKKAQSRK